MDQRRSLRYNSGMLDSFWPSLFTLHVVSAVAYLVHCIAVWSHWTGFSKDSAPLWMRANLCWVFAGSGTFPLTNGRIVSHLGLALIPWVNTMLLAMQLGYVLVSLAERLWTLHLRTWWNRPVHGH